jgi:hypothetical protein
METGVANEFRLWPDMAPSTPQAAILFETRSDVSVRR